MRPTVGRIVRYKFTEKEYRPAIIVKVATSTTGWRLQLQVFLDGFNDIDLLRNSPTISVPEFSDGDCLKGITWRSEVKEGDKIGEWSWPPREE